MKALGTSCASLRALSTRAEIGLTLFQDILECVPRLETLHLLRERNWWSSGIRSEDDDMQESILRFLPGLGRFQHLRKLVLLDTLTFDEGKEKSMARLKKHGKEALSGRVAAGVEIHCPSVAELWVGYVCFRRDERGLMRSSPGLNDPAGALVIYGA
ncbi:hypothetical protein JAAARDRAFT_663638 [Jaapia argillacea MUCL 33604]|uniref:Uncharacterized protein n=1 Tax=Jaapia argillacea MUCL 33604 TaxID=933084 RepID=A0A067P5R5_9AGAM|nr:hypothetical protein JAAARDRAFT_663638 [Jaapia argillacea MUCL 33604]